MQTNRVSHRVKFLYGVGAFGYGSIGQTISSFLMFFSTAVLGIPGALVGLAFGISTLWDATTDPIVGHLSDKTKSRTFGKRHGWILTASVLVALFNLLIWLIPGGIGVWGKFWLLLMFLLLLETVNTCYSTPYGALGLDLSRNYYDRTAVQNYKTAFSFLSLLVPSLLMIFFLQNARDYSGYIGIAFVTSALCVICAIICFAGTYKYRHKTIGDQRAAGPIAESEACLEEGATREKFSKRVSKIFEDFFGIIKQKNVGRLIAGYAVSLSAGAFLTSLGLHVFTFTFGFSTIQIPIIMVCFIAGIILGQPFWYFVSKKTDKVIALVSALGLLLVCMAFFSVLLVFRGFIPIEGSLTLIASVIFLSGLAVGCLYCMPISMFADCIARQQQETGVISTGKSAGFLTFCTKISNAVILFIIGLSLDIIGFSGAHATQSMSVQNWLGWLLIAGVSIASVTAMFIYSKYSYTKSDFE